MGFHDIPARRAASTASAKRGPDRARAALRALDHAFRRCPQHSEKLTGESGEVLGRSVPVGFDPQPRVDSVRLQHFVGGGSPPSNALSSVTLISA